MRLGGADFIVTEFEAWLDEMATQPLPGGVAAAALAAAMGAALVAKVARVGQSLRAPGLAGQRARPSLVTLAQASQLELLHLVAADEAAYRRVLDTRHLPAADEARREAWQQATALPLSLAETCQRLLAKLPRGEDLAAPRLAVDLEIGRRLLQAGTEAGMLAARENLSAWGAHLDADSYRRRLAALSGERIL